MKSLAQHINESIEINEASKLTQKTIKDTLGRYIGFFNIKGASTWDDVKPKATLGVYGINCGANCGQYTLMTRYGWSAVEMIDSNESSVLYATKDYASFLYGSKGSFKVGDNIYAADNDNYNKQLYAGNIVGEIISNKKEYQDWLGRNGYQVYPAKAFSKPSGKVSRGFSVVSIKGIINLEDQKQELISKIN